MNRTYREVLESLDNQVWLICMTLTGWSLSDVLNLSEMDRERWVEKCEEYQEKLQDDMGKSR